MANPPRVLAPTEQAEADNIKRREQLSAVMLRTLRVLKDDNEYSHNQIVKITGPQTGNKLRILDHLGLADMIKRDGGKYVYRMTAKGKAVLEADGKLIDAVPSPSTASGGFVAGHEQPVQVVAAPPASTDSSTLPSDLTEILDKEIAPTTKEALVNARVGQGQFRLQVFQQWGNRCCVTGSVTLDAIRASHIKPWRESTDEERRDPNNGLPLVASLDALFDKGLISFDSSGRLIVSSALSPAEQHIFGIGEKSLREPPTAKTAEYLAQHRNRFFPS